MRMKKIDTTAEDYIIYILSFFSIWNALDFIPIQMELTSQFWDTLTRIQGDSQLCQIDQIKTLSELNCKGDNWIYY